MDSEERLGWGMVWFVTIFLSAVLTATVILESGGRKPENHVGPIPEKVSQLDARAYLVEDDGPSMSSVCRSDAGDGDTIESSQRIPKLKATYIKCNQAQTWNDKQEGSKSFVNSFLVLVQSVPFYIGLGFLALICFGPCLVELYRERKRAQEAQEAVERRAAKEKVERQTKEVALATSYAQHAITEEEYEEALNRLYGLPEGS